MSCHLQNVLRELSALAVDASMTHVCDNVTQVCVPIAEVAASLCADLVSEGLPLCLPTTSEEFLDSLAVVLVIVLALGCAFLGYKLHKNNQAEAVHAALFDGEENDFQI